MNVSSTVNVSAPIADLIPVCRPLLPPVERLTPYLARLDKSRWYSNHGELVVELEGRLARAFGTGRPVVASTSSGVAALTGAVLATAGRATAERPLALVPAYTFIGTISAIEACGYVPYLVDMDAQTWCLAAESLSAHPMLPRAGLIMPVAAHGRPVPVAPWQRLQEATGVPVVIDAAAAFESLCDDPAAMIGGVPVCLSFQATKAFCTGEGGAVVCRDEAVVERSMLALNFGFGWDRVTRMTSTNGKMSEYHAAVGLAEFDGWADKRAAYRRVAARYCAAAGRHGIAARMHVAPSVGSNYAIFAAADADEAARASQAMAARGIGFRLWYGLGLHHQPYLADAGRDALPVTDALAPRLIGVPVSLDMRDADIDTVVAALASACR